MEWRLSRECTRTAPPLGTCWSCPLGPAHNAVSDCETLLARPAPGESVGRPLGTAETGRLLSQPSSLRGEQIWTGRVCAITGRRCLATTPTGNKYICTYDHGTGLGRAASAGSRNHCVQAVQAYTGGLNVRYSSTIRSRACAQSGEGAPPELD